MGMYDEVVFNCPECGNLLVEQSKAGECILQSIGSDSVPLDIAHDIIGEYVYCEDCDKSFTIKEKYISRPETIPLMLE